MGSGLFLVYRPRLPAAVIPAVGADAVRPLRLVTVRAFAQANRLQRVMRAALRGARFRVSSFWIRHRCDSFSSQLSAFGYQLLAISFWLTAFSFSFSARVARRS